MQSEFRHGNNAPSSSPETSEQTIHQNRQPPEEGKPSIEREREQQQKHERGTTHLPRTATA